MIKDDPSPNFARIFAQRPDLEPPGYKETVKTALEATRRRKETQDAIRNQKKKR